MLSERCDWSSIWFAVILESSGSCFLRKMRRQVARRKSLLIYFGYGIWNSTLEISAREQALHQSMYQRYDVDDPFSVEEGFSYATEGESQEDWGGPAEDKGFYYQQMSEAKTNARTSSKAKSKSKHKQNSEALIANDELDYSPE
ncbi:putative cationic amino acid transporter [Microtus ochrogaster]|uniref:Putative cationic amino acid transporter n=1 Tax=Microtus ochrogaster TaxID=79684 RepID=A0A8J6L1L3_MICOH|nr:putative cationic amino acid transporter [Microtus ochrogaster]